MTTCGFCEEAAESKKRIGRPLISCWRSGKSALILAMSNGSTAVAAVMTAPSWRDGGAPALVALGLELGGELHAARGLDPAVDQQVHVGGLQLVEQALVVGDDQQA